MQDTIMNKTVRMRMPKGVRNFTLTTDSDVNFQDMKLGYNTPVQNPELSGLVMKRLVRRLATASTVDRNESVLWGADVDGRMSSCANGNDG